MTPPPRAPIRAVLAELPARIKNHNMVVMTAGIAFYGLLALVPALAVVIGAEYNAVAERPIRS